MATGAEALAALERGEAVDLLDADLYADDPEPVYAWLRANAPAYRDSNGLVCVSRNRDITTIERNAELYTSRHGSRPLFDMSDDESMINLDDPRHSAQRRMVLRRFTPTGVRSNAESVRAIARELVADVAVRGRCDVVEDLASVQPAIVICELLGFERSRWPDCRRWAADTLRAGSLRHDDHRLKDWATSLNEFIVETSALIAERRASPREDLVSVWCHTEVDGELLSDKAILEEALLLLDGGAETSRNVIANGLLALIEHPEQRALVHEDPSILERTGVEELIRWVTPIMNMRRTITADHELHGLSVKAGDQVLLMYSAGNRDDSVFADPHRLDLTRPSNHHVAFGGGTHYCLGANLARFEIRTMLEEIFRQIPDFRVATGASPSIAPSFFTRGLASLEIEYTPA